MPQATERISPLVIYRLPSTSWRKRQFQCLQSNTTSTGLTEITGTMRSCAHIKAMSRVLSFLLFSSLSDGRGRFVVEFSSPAAAAAAATVTRAVDSRSNLKIMQRHFAPHILH